MLRWLWSRCFEAPIYWNCCCVRCTWCQWEAGRCCYDCRSFMRLMTQKCPWMVCLVMVHSQILASQAFDRTNFAWFLKGKNPQDQWKLVVWCLATSIVLFLNSLVLNFLKVSLLLPLAYQWFSEPLSNLLSKSELVRI